MSRALSALRSTDPAVFPGRLPTARQLASLGTVLCLYRPDSSELGGWKHAVSAHACQGMDSEGIRESLCFADARGRCCWRLYLLPDSDFLAWDRLVSAFPARPEPVNDGGVAERLWRRLATRLGAEPWRMCALRLHAGDGQGLSASLAALSSLGASAARRIAHVEGADGELWIDDCCCASAARLAPLRRDPTEAPWVRL
ncbi:Hemin transport protein [Stenotrophomonas sp. BIGb0135]|uniref:Hemin transport protein n=1 Tax=Stenotrophomonas sp. BIGb0135 TaxID=2940620 RepID=UPI00216A23E6|nr:Hemin transport protein [Stenotrophomonas sp. BIGb0135]MCS4236375.1 hypothetical protein [Stenotrophomonas sp. BIGb0135]